MPLKALNNLVLASGVRVTSGSSFPTSPTPVVGDIHWHTTRLRRYGYDGTRWLSEPFDLPLIPYYAGGVQPFTTTGTYYVGGLSPDADLWIDSFRCGHYFSGANSGSAYWSVQLAADYATGASALATYTTAAATAGGAYLAPAVTAFAVNPLPRATYFDVTITLAKTGAAPSIEIYPALRVREVG